MSLPRSSYDPRRVCIVPLPNISFSPHKRTIGVYAAGALFALGNWLFLDAAILSAHATPPPDAPHDTVPVHVAFVDWLPGLFSIFGLLIVNLIDKERLIGDGGAFGEGGLVWRARLFLFVGFALMAGGLAGSVTVLVLKYILPTYPDQYTYYGYANVAQNVSLMASAVVLWLAQNSASEYEYRLSL
ncbi:hypothetical protein FRB96_007135 [Tulasnella sp. 330]|nr:hypothetical protein FRB96_007135 [Tulasnella sp. 330]KAG8876438.1 hypothetical protein FRB97_004175 [Tulasnella sp. 331]KAG8881880.1 hypothetical protein FRB98_004073 [Tulasnella sp. 332]